MITKLPSWFKQEIPSVQTLERIKVLKELKIHTVCQESHCPNLSSCFKKKELTFLILGDTCTRNCYFCAVKKAKNKNVKLPIDLREPEQIRRMVESLSLGYIVLTSVTRDDLEDKGAGQFRRTIEAISKISPKPRIELLIPDFAGSKEALVEVIKAKPDVIGHNLEIVERLYIKVRERASYQRSLDLLKQVKLFDSSMITKSSLILGLGESEEEVIDTIKDLVEAKVNILVLGQYLSPSPQHYPVKEFISIEQFNRYQDLALQLGIKTVLSEPLARSSYKAEQLYEDVSNKLL